MEANNTDNGILHSIHRVPNLIQAPPGGVRLRPTCPCMDVWFIRGFRLELVDITISGGLEGATDEEQARRRGFVQTMCDNLPAGPEGWPCDLQGPDWRAIRAFAETLGIELDIDLACARDPFNELVPAAERAEILLRLQTAAV